MLMSGFARSSVWKATPPLSSATVPAVSGVTCIRPRAPALEVWSRKRDSS